MPIDVYMMPASAPCRAVIMTGKLLGLDMNLKSINLMEGEHMTPEFLKINPMHTVPTIDDNGLCLWESRAIMQYLANKYGPDNPLYPTDPEKRARVDLMLNFDLGTLYRAEGEYLYPQIFKGEKPSEEKLENFKKALGHFNTFLQKCSYAAGEDLTLADLSLFASLTFAEVADFDFSEFPKIQKWLASMKKELPFHNEVNEEPLNGFKEWLKQKKGQ